MNVPGSVANPTVKFLALEIPVTLNSLLNPLEPAPVVLLVLVKLTSSTEDPIFKLCGSSVSIVALDPLQLAPETNLKFLCSLELEILPVPKYV